MTCPTCAAARGIVYAKEDPPREHTDDELLTRLRLLVEVARKWQQRRNALDVVIDALGGGK